jgi:hypothetical protein
MMTLPLRALNPVLSKGNFSRALPGNSWRAPKFTNRNARNACTAMLTRRGCILRGSDFSRHHAQSASHTTVNEKGLLGVRGARGPGTWEGAAAPRTPSKPFSVCSSSKSNPKQLNRTGFWLSLGSGLREARYPIGVEKRGVANRSRATCLEANTRFFRECPDRDDPTGGP